MKVSAALFSLVPSHPFGISREVADEYTTILIRIEELDIVGYGEAFPSRRYENSAEDNLIKFRSVSFREIESFIQEFQPRCTYEWSRITFNDIDSLVSGFTSAYYDWHAQRMKLPVANLVGFGGQSLPVSSFTIGLDTLDIIEQKVREADDYPVLKIKLGTDRDEAIINRIRKITDKPLRVDANEGWNREEALEKINWLAEQNVQFIEQPLPAGHYDESRWLRKRSPIPIFADEDCRHIADLPYIVDCYDGINIKLVKCGGIIPAMQMIHTAKTFEMAVMLGCMVESSVGIAPAAMLAGGVDYLDLDGNLLLANDPFKGPKAFKGIFSLFNSPGLGITPISKMNWETIYQT